MKLAILSRNPKLYSTQRLVEAATQRELTVEVIDYLRCYMNITSDRPKVMFQGRSLDIDAIVPRIGTENSFYGASVVRQFEMAGAYSVAASLAIARARDKLRALQVLSARGLGLPTTGFAHSTSDISGLIDLVGGAPLVVKLLEGTQGIGVVLCETRKAAESVIEAFRGMNVNILIQEFIAESAGADIRAFVVGRKVVASMLRQGAPGEFRSNIHRGGTGSAVTLTAQERTIAVRAARAVGLRVAGVDLLRSDRGLLVIEVNSSPGLEGIEGATGIDVAGQIIDYVVKHARPGKGRDRGKDSVGV